MRSTKTLCFIAMLLMLGSFTPSRVNAQSIYSERFDYKLYRSSAAYFLGKSTAWIDELCKAQHNASQEDMDQCAHREFEDADDKLNKELRLFSEKAARNDKSLKADNYPLAWPYFKNSQDAWVQYRDNYCYGETYGLGQASMRYIVFWGCMERITKSRLQELKAPDAG